MAESVPLLVYLLGAVLLALTLTCLYFLYRINARNAGDDPARLAVLEERLASRDAEVQELKRQLEQEKASLQQERGELAELRDRLGRQETLLQQERRAHEEKLQLLQQAREQMSLEFKQLAGEILEQKGKSFSESNQQQIQNLLKPLGEKIQAFEKKVEDTYDKESKQRFALEKEIRSLFELNSRISIEADNLTRALKGESKTQGNWGEVILERVLEKSGLQKGREYETQASFRDDSGARSQPDVIIHLPEGKDVIVDAKVSLKDYEAYFSSEDEAERARHLKQHIQSVRNHIKGLSEKHYENLSGIRTLDFVLLFLPVEPAFTLAVQHDDNLFTEAFSRNIILVGPSTLLATLRTIQSIWRYEYQNRHALEIASSAGKLYDKFVGFCEDLDKIGERLQQTRQAWESAQNKLGSGRGNLIRSTEKLQKLGARATKALPQKWLDRAGMDDPEELSDELPDDTEASDDATPPGDRSA